jgi:putative endonuclease
LARVTAFQAVGRGFESRLPLQYLVQSKVAFYVYILKSQKFDKYYIGQTANLTERVEYHNSSKARWTKRFQPWVLKHFEEFNTRSEVMIKEKYLKSLKKIEWYLNSKVPQ